MQYFKLHNPNEHLAIPCKGSDLINQKVGRLSVIRKADGKHKDMYLCKCECGKTIEVLRSSLRSRKVTHCGCLRRVPVTPEARAEIEARHNGQVSPAFGRKKTKGFNYGFSKRR